MNFDSNVIQTTEDCLNGIFLFSLKNISKILKGILNPRV